MLYCKYSKHVWIRRPILDQNKGLKKLITLTAIFLVVDLVVEQIGVYQLLNWAYDQFHMTQFQANFSFKLIELIVVLILNALITKQKFYMKPSFSWVQAAYWVFIVAVMLPFLSADNVVEGLLTGAMGGFPEEFLARGVLLGLFLTYLLKEDYSRKTLVKGIFYSNLVFGLMHMTNLSHQPVGYVIVQCVLAFVAGLAYTAIYVQTGTIFSAVAMHFAKDFMLTATSGSQMAMVATAAFSYFKILLVIVAFLYWKNHEPALSKKIRGAK